MAQKPGAAEMMASEHEHRVRLLSGTAPGVEPTFQAALTRRVRTAVADAADGASREVVSHPYSINPPDPHCRVCGTTPNVALGTHCPGGSSQ